MEITVEQYEKTKDSLPIQRGDETRQLVLDLAMIPVVPPKYNRITPWEYDRALYKQRNEPES
jgi:hypothetical protein